MNLNFNREDIISAIQEIDKNPSLKSKRHSSTYDLVYEGTKYPPILVLSIASTLKGNEELTLSSFGNNVEIPFKILRDNGFEVVQKSNHFKLNLTEFIRVAKQQTTGLGTNESAKLFIRENKGFKSDLKIDISFGAGRASAIPWIAFLGFNQSVKHGIYPVYLYYKDYNIMEV